jgi:hypothetical protein
MARPGGGVEVSFPASIRTWPMGLVLLVLAILLLAGGCDTGGEVEEDETGEGDFVCQAVCRLPDGTLEPGGSRRFPGFGEDEAQRSCEAPLTGGVDLCLAPASFSGHCNCTEEPEDADLRVPLR